jgi:hypothetical protein
MPKSKTQVALKARMNPFCQACLQPGRYETYWVASFGNITDACFQGPKARFISAWGNAPGIEMNKI